jgi:DNA repair protein RadA/Sms
VQALVAKTTLPTPRRATSGLDPARLAMLLAVLDRRAGQRLSDHDVYAATVGGVRLVEPAADLAVALAVAGSVRDRALAGDLVALGEVGLAGEVRPVTAVGARLQEAARLGFARALVPPGCGVRVPGLVVHEVGDLRSALQTALRAAPSPALRATPSTGPTTTTGDDADDDDLVRLDTARLSVG